MQQPGTARTTFTPFDELPEVWRRCLELAWESFVNGSLPIGAVITSAEGEVLATGRNRLSEASEQAPHVPGTPYIGGSPLAHAEVNALLQMGFDRPQPRPILYTTTEPCPLCMGASRMSGVGHVVYASRDVWAGAAIMAESVPYIQVQGPSVEGPVHGLEEALMTWLLAAFGAEGQRTASFIGKWRADFPRAAAVGLRLNRSQALRRVAEEGVQAVWAALGEELTAHAS